MTIPLDQAGQADRAEMPEPVWPVALPADVAQPWEKFDAQGKVSASINAGSEFYAGVQTYQLAGNTAEHGEALQLASGDYGSGELSYAMYRLVMGGLQPGAISADVNLRLMNNGNLSSYSIGLSKYSENSWEWHGPFTDSHVRLGTGAGVATGANYLSGLGNTFICIVAHDGAAVDVVGLGANPVAAGDTTPPDAPVLSALTPVAGGLEIEWLHGGAADLAGFKVYYAPTFFTYSSLPGVEEVNYFEGGNRHLLTGISSLTYIRVAAVDFSGNISDLSSIMNAVPLPGSPPDLILVTDEVSGLIGCSMNLTAGGADSYDWDLDGDGVFEVTEDTGGAQTVTPGAVGIIRPAVRGTAGGGDGIACGSVSLLISGNARPVAQGYADPTSGFAPLTVTFTSLSSDFDGTVVKWAWDFDGDKTYDYVTEVEADKNPPPHVYSAPGLYNAKFRAWDDDGAWDVDTVAVDVREGSATDPVAVLRASPLGGDAPVDVTFSAADSYDPDGTIVDYEWDLNGDGLFNDSGTEFIFRGQAVPATVSFNAGLPVTVAVRVTDDSAATAIDTVTITAHGWEIVTVDDFGAVGAYCSLAVVDGNPAISYFDFTNTDLKYVRATTNTGGNTGDWANSLTVDSAGDVGQHTSLAVVDGNPAISYYDIANSALKYARATTSTGDSIPDWSQIITVDNAADVGRDTSLAVVDGNPAISYRDVTNKDLKYARATNSTGSLVADWSVILTLDSAGDVGQHTSLAVVDGCPAIAYWDNTNSDLKYARATTPGGGLIGDWTQIITVLSTGDTGYNPSLAVIDGNPAIACYNFTGHDLVYVRSTTSTGGSVPDWSQYSIVEDTGDVGDFASLAVINGRPVISYYDLTNDNLKYSRSATFTGAAPSDWIGPNVADGTFGVGRYCSQTEVMGCPAICYRDEMNLELKYAIGY